MGWKTTYYRRQTVIKEAQDTGKLWEDTKNLTSNRARRRSFIEALRSS